jgi:hypothetical protein
MSCVDKTKLLPTSKTVVSLPLLPFFFMMGNAGEKTGQRAAKSELNS